MSVDRVEVDRIARLARLSLEGEEADRLTEEMNRILEHAERLKGVGSEDGSVAGGGGGADERRADERTSEGEADSVSTSGMGGVRDDAGHPDPLRGTPADFAPAWDQRFFVVPPPPGVTAEDGE